MVTIEDGRDLPGETDEVIPEHERNEARKGPVIVKWTEGLVQSEPVSSVKHTCQRKPGTIVRRFSFGRLRFSGLSMDSSRWSDVWASPPVGVDDSTTRFQRRMLLVTLVAGLTAFLSIAVIVGIIYYNKEPVHKQQSSDCYTAECADAIVYIKTLVNNSIDPCTDFYGHVCSKWQHEREGEGFLKDAASTFLRNLHDKIQYHGVRRHPLPKATSILVSLYWSCDRFLSSVRSFNEVIATYMKLFDIPRLLQSSTLTEIIRHVIHVSLTRGASTTFKLQLEKSGEKSHLHIQPERPLSEKLTRSDGLQLLGKYFEAVIGMIAPNTTAGEVVAFDEKVESVHSSVLTVEWMPFEELGNLMHSVPAGVWRDAINAELPAGRKIARNDVVRARCYGEIKQVIEFLISEPLPLIVVYMSLHTVSDVLILDYAARYRRSGPTETMHLCLSITKKTLPFRWILLVQGLMPELGVSTNGTLGIHEDVKWSLVDHGMPTWMDATTRRKAQVRVNTTTLRFYQDCMSAVDTDGVTIPALRGDFLEDYSTLLRFSHTELLQDPPDHELREMEDLMLCDRPFYSETSWSIFIPPTLQRGPVLYDSELAPYFNYGTLGALIAKEMSTIIGPQAASQKPSVDTEDWWSGITRWNFIGVSRCYSRLYWKAKHPKGKIFDLSPDLEDSIFAWTNAARIALDSLMRRHNYREEERKSELQTFFRRFCLLSCDVQFDATTSSTHQCVVPLMNLKEFASAFKCSAGTLMNPRERCP